MMVCLLLFDRLDCLKENINMLNMSKLVDTFERLMVAVTFAEAGDHETARNIMKKKPANRRERPHMKVRNQVDQRPVLRA